MPKIENIRNIAINSRSSIYEQFDKNSGRCRMSEKLMQARHIRLGSLIKLRLFVGEEDFLEVLCTAWPDTNNRTDENVIIVDDTVRIGPSTHSEANILGKTQWSKLPFEITNILASKSCSSVQISGPSNVNSQLLYIHHFVGLPIIPGCTIQLSPYQRNPDVNSIANYRVLRSNPNQACTVSSLSILIPYDKTRDDNTVVNETIAGEGFYCPTEVVTTLVTRVLMPARLGMNSLMYCKGVLLHGPPGVGKTFAVTALKRYCRSWCNLRIEEINIPHLLSEPDPLASLQSVFLKVKELRKAMHTIVGNNDDRLQCTSPSLKSPTVQSPTVQSPQSQNTRYSFQSPSTSDWTARKPPVSPRTLTSKELDAIFVVIDEIDALGSTDSAPQSDLQLALRLAIANWMDTLVLDTTQRSVGRTGKKSCFCIVATSNRPGAVDPLFRRGGRLDLEVAVTNAPVEREQLLRTFFETAMKGLLPARNGTIASTPPSSSSSLSSSSSSSSSTITISSEMIASMALMTGGYVAADLFALVREMLLHLPLQEDKETMEGSKPSWDWREAFFAAGKVVPPSCLRGVSVKIPQMRFKDIIGHEEVKRQLRRLVSMFSPALRERVKLFRLKYPGGVLLHGPPGNAKTQLAMAAANEFALPVISLSAADIYSPFVGDAEAEVRRAFSLARQASPCMLFIDELDSIVTNRASSSGGTNSRVEGRLLATFLTEMDGVAGGGEGEGCGVVVFAATNRLSCIDSALTRKGRFHHVLPVDPPPDRATRLQVLHSFAERAGLDMDAQAVREMEEELEKRQRVVDEEDRNDVWGEKSTEIDDKRLSGADIENICREQLMSRIRNSV